MQRMVVRLLVSVILCLMFATSARFLFETVSPRVLALMPNDGAAQVYPGLPIAIGF